MGGVFRESVRSFLVPKELECDRAIPVKPADSIYVEGMNEYLFRGVGRHPALTDDRVRNFVVHQTDPRRWKKTAFALLVGTGRMVSFQDYMCWCRIRSFVESVPAKLLCQEKYFVVRVGHTRGFKHPCWALQSVCFVEGRRGGRTGQVPIRNGGTAIEECDFE